VLGYQKMRLVILPGLAITYQTRTMFVQSLHEQWYKLLESGENQNCGLSTHFLPRIARIRRIFCPIFREIRVNSWQKEKRQSPVN